METTDTCFSPWVLKSLWTSCFTIQVTFTQSTHPGSYRRCHSSGRFHLTTSSHLQTTLDWSRRKRWWHRGCSCSICRERWNRAEWTKRHQAEIKVHFIWVWSLSLRGCDGSEPLLARCVPDLQFNSLSIDVYCSDLEVHTDGGDVAACRIRTTRDTSCTLSVQTHDLHLSTNHDTDSVNIYIRPRSRTRGLHMTGNFWFYSLVLLFDLTRIPVSDQNQQNIFHLQTFR